MELRDYLMPGEYILTRIKGLNMHEGMTSTGKTYKNLAITNKRFILFNTKRKLLRSEDISEILSFQLGNVVERKIEYKKAPLTKEKLPEVMYITTCRFVQAALFPCGPPDFNIKLSQFSSENPYNTISRISDAVYQLYPYVIKTEGSSSETFYHFNETAKENVLSLFGEIAGKP